MSELTFKSGTYFISNKVNNKIYVGSSCDLEKRKNEHFRTLRKGVHKNRYMQASYNKNPDSFAFSVYEYVPARMVLKAEQELLNVLFDNQNRCYNINPYAHSSKGRKSVQTKKIYMFDREQNLIREFDSILEATKETGINNCSISLAANGKLKSSGGFLWSGSPNPPKQIKKKTNKKMHVRQILSPAGEVVSFNNLRTFCSKHKLNYNSIHSVLKGKRTSCFGWKKVKA